MKVLSYDGFIFVAQIEQSEIEKIDFALCKGSGTGGRQTLQSYYNSCTKKPDLLVNGGFFNMANGETVWTYKDEGKMIMDYGAAYHNGIGTVNGKLQYGNLSDYNYSDFVTGYPVLVINKKAAPNSMIGYNDSGINGKYRRTAIGYNTNYVYIVCVDKPGMTFSQMQDFFINKLNCDYAVNLDGGGSTRMMRDGSLVTFATAENRAVDNVVAVYVKRDSTNVEKPVIPSTGKGNQTLFRVQVGAYGYQGNAQALLRKLQAYPEFKGAYIKKVGALYKVQVGAFSSKTRAINLKNKLKAKGFDAFVV